MTEFVYVYVRGFCICLCAMPSGSPAIAPSQIHGSIGHAWPSECGSKLLYMWRSACFSFTQQDHTQLTVLRTAELRFDVIAEQDRPAHSINEANVDRSVPGNIPGPPKQNWAVNLRWHLPSSRSIPRIGGEES